MVECVNPGIDRCEMLEIVPNDHFKCYVLIKWRTSLSVLYWNFVPLSFEE